MRPRMALNLRNPAECPLLRPFKLCYVFTYSHFCGQRAFFAPVATFYNDPSRSLRMMNGRPHAAHFIRRFPFGYVFTTRPSHL